MFVFLICILTLHRAHTVCVVPDICPDNPAVQTEIVDLHNAYRRAVQPPAADMLMMNYSVELAASAQAWVDKCILAHGDPSTRMIDGYQLGENLFFASSPYTWAYAIYLWHHEEVYYHYPSGSTDKDVGHYTQVVWNSSYKVGCGVALCPKNIYFYACHYYRAGNFRSWPPYKAGPPCSSCPDDCVDGLCTNPCPIVDHFINCPSLKLTYGCKNVLVYMWCPASCTCTNKIIPIG